MSAEVFSPSKEKEETEKSEGREEGETVELYPQGGLMAIHSDKSSDKGPENRIEKILPSTSKVIKDSLEETAIGQRIRDEETIQKLRDETGRSDQKTREFEKALGIALQTIQRLEKEEERRKPVLNEEKKKKYQN